MPTPKVTASAAGVNRSGQPGHAGYRLIFLSALVSCLGHAAETDIVQPLAAAKSFSDLTRQPFCVLFRRVHLERTSPRRNLSEGGCHLDGRCFELDRRMTGGTAGQCTAMHGQRTSETTPGSALSGRLACYYLDHRAPSRLPSGSPSSGSWPWRGKRNMH